MIVKTPMKITIQECTTRDLASLTNDLLECPIVQQDVNNIEYQTQRIIRAVQMVYPVTITQLQSKSRRAYLVTCRQLCMYFMHKILPVPLVYIGEVFGGRDHSTVIHAIKCVEDHCFIEPLYSEKFEIIEKYLTNNKLKKNH